MNTTVTRSTNKTPYEIVSQRKGAQQLDSLSSEIDKKRRKLRNFSIHDTINRVDKKAFEVRCPVRQEISETVLKNLEKSIEKWEKNTTFPEKLKQVKIMSETVYPYTYPKETCIQQMSKDCHLIEKGHFNAAKLQVAIDQKIPFGRENIDFFGNEFDLTTKPYLVELYKHEVSYSCNSPYCTNKEILKEAVNCPSLIVVNPVSNIASADSSSEMINEWFEEESVTRCKQKATSNVPENFYFTDENSTTK